MIGLAFATAVFGAAGAWAFSNGLRLIERDREGLALLLALVSLLLLCPALCGAFYFAIVAFDALARLP